MSEKNKINYFHPQAYLMYLVSNKKGAIQKSKLKPGKREKVSVYQIGGKYEPTGVVSKIYNSKNAAGNSLIKNNFFNLEPYKITALVPELRFYKAEGDKLTPFYLPITSLSEDAVSLNSPSRMGASAVKTFTVEYTGTDPFTAPKYLKANMQLYIDNLQNIFAAPPEKGYARLADLFTISMPKSRNIKGKGDATINTSEMVRPIEVAATLGYSIINRDIFTQEEIEEIISSNLSLRMNVYSHNINIEQNGTATIDISYTARIDNAGRDKMFSATDSPGDLLARADLKQLTQSEKKKAGDIKKIDTKDALEKKAKKQEAKLDECRRLLEILENQGKIYSVKAKAIDLLTYNTLGAYKPPESTAGSLPNVTLQLGGSPLSTTSESPFNASLGVDGLKLGSSEPPRSELLASEPKRTLLSQLSELDTSEREIFYITFADLLEAFVQKVHENLTKAMTLTQYDSSMKKNPLVRELFEREGILGFFDKKEEEKKNIRKVIRGALKKLETFKILLADVHYTAYQGQSTITEKEKVTKNRINIGDIPISLYTYQKFMYDAVMNTNRNTWVIPQFLESCIRKGGLLDKAMAEWAQAGIATNVISDFPDFTSNVFSGAQLRSKVSSKQFISPKDINVQKSFSASSLQDESDYYLIYQSPTRQLSADRSGNKSTDAKRGVYHFEVGKNRGLFKNINFSRIDVPFVQEQLMTNQVGMYDELKMVYKADIEMVGNNLFFPGSQLFVDPGTIGFGNPRDMNSAAYRLGLGGYYTVISVTTSITNGVATTNLGCMYEARAAGKDSETSKDLPPSVAGYVKEKLASADAEMQPLPNLKVDTGPYYGLSYSKLLELRDPETNGPVVSTDLARSLSEDFHKTPSARPQKLVGVNSRQVDIESGTVIYHLVNGKSIKMERKQGKEAVSLTQTYKTLPSKY